MDDTIKNLYMLFDTAYEMNMNGCGTDITRMITTFVPDAIQDLQAYESMFKEREKPIRCWSDGAIDKLPPSKLVFALWEDGSCYCAELKSINEDGTITIIESNKVYEV